MCVGKIHCVHRDKSYLYASVWKLCVYFYLLWVCKYAYTSLHMHECVQTFFASDESGINCERLAPLMLLFLPLWQLCWAVQSSTADTKKILWQSLSLLSLHCNLTASGLVNVMNPLSSLRYQLSSSFSRTITILCQIWIHTVKVTCNGVSIHYFQAFVIANGVYTHTHIYSNTHIQTEVSLESCPCLFSDRVSQSAAVQGGSGYSESIQSLRSSLPLLVPWNPLPSLYQAEVMDDSLFPSRTWQRTKKNRKENKGKKAF